MQIQLNGRSKEVATGATVADLLVELELDSRTLAVERNLELAPRTEHAATQLAEGDRIEIVTLVGGG
ncbi:sulfur carrier protein ThiS [Adhaeretor mobilis]|nr:sulfur carrier protein ThiS [Adhaeretor mobilis]